MKRSIWYDEPRPWEPEEDARADHALELRILMAARKREREAQLHERIHHLIERTGSVPARRCY